MPFVGGDGRSSCKRLREDEDDDDRDGYRHSTPHKQRPGRPTCTARKTLPLTKRARVKDQDDDAVHDIYASELSTPAQRPRLQTFHSAPVLAPCHICHRRPTKKTDIKAFAQCQGCGERTCYICMRVCHGWPVDDAEDEQEAMSRSLQMDDVDPLPTSASSDNFPGFRDQSATEPMAQPHDTHRLGQGWAATGHCTKVCSRCSVERGSMGDVVCLGCLAGMEGA
ncbi:hypothetical protein S7711_05314 [Stachybotrys chartarum IBT 7711]|uniref:Uncharacterized protein n=1 Tax=Stachybotrys chartarum (strain CBS 109288 / IBT 7711) TaxID=1280523 RepID=A0A084ALG4_STACB|nr:hypothetical protein S7711_05314 [Stachybotrys chartarum IBT 7711]